MSDAKENNKFQGIKYCAISSKMEVIAIRLTPEAAYREAVIKGEPTPIIVQGYIIENEKKEEN
jgi:hypothetical protein